MACKCDSRRSGQGSQAILQRSGPDRSADEYDPAGSLCRCLARVQAWAEMPGCWTGQLTSGKSSKGRVKGSSSAAASPLYPVLYLPSHTLQLCASASHRASWRKALSHGISLRHLTDVQAGHRQERAAHHDVALLEVSVNVNALQVLAAWQHCCLSGALLWPQGLGAARAHAKATHGTSIT